jgi:hypothetical protein
MIHAACDAADGLTFWAALFRQGTYELISIDSTRFGYGWSERPAPPGSAGLAEAMKPFYPPCIESFGAERCMFESNFPVDRRAYSYTVMWNAFKRFAAGFSPDERRALFHDTAAGAYRL